MAAIINQVKAHSYETGGLTYWQRFMPQRLNDAVSGNCTGQLVNSRKHDGHNFHADMFLWAQEGKHLFAYKSISGDCFI